MSYRINTTNGDLVVELADGELDTTSTDITLVGRNSTGFGESINENFIRVMENFANSNPPGNPLTGQLWFDTNAQRLKIYTGEVFKTAGAPIVSSTQPIMVAGDLWIDTTDRKLYFYDGNASGDVTLVGPEYSSSQGKTGFEAESVIDDNNKQRVVLKLFIGGELVAVVADAEFRLPKGGKILGYPDDPNDTVLPKRQLIEKGYNIIDENFLFRGVATSTKSIQDDSGNRFESGDFLFSNQNEETTGTITIQNSEGLTVGSSGTDYVTLQVIGSTSVIEMQQPETDFAIRTRITNAFDTPFYIDSSESAIGIYNTSPQYTLDITGNFHATGSAVFDGDLTVNGSATYVNVDTLRVKDKNIELALLDDSTEGNDNDVDGAGITVRSSQGSKDLVWNLSSNSWKSNVNIDLDDEYVYKIGGNSILSKTTLSNSVTTAAGLTRIGTLVDLNVDNINLNSNVISTQPNSDLVINPQGTGSINVNNNSIKNVAYPLENNDASTKTYVDIEIKKLPVVLSLDITGLTNPNSDVLDILEDLSPAAEKENGVFARIIAVDYANTDISGIDIQSAMDKSFVTINNIEDPFDLEDNLTAESIVQDVNFSTANAIFTPIPTRYLFVYQVVNGSWIWQSTNTYEV